MLTRRTALMGGIGLAATALPMRHVAAAEDVVAANKAIAKRFVNDILNAEPDVLGSPPKAWSELISPDFQPEIPDELPGPDALWDRLSFWIHYNHDGYQATCTIEHLMADQKSTMLRGYVVGEFDGRKLRTPYFFDFTIKDGQIVGLWKADAMWDD